MRVILPGDDDLLDARERAALRRIAAERSSTACPWLADRCDRWIAELIDRSRGRAETVERVLGRPREPRSFVRELGGPA